MSPISVDPLGTVSGWPSLPPLAAASLDGLRAGNARFLRGESRRPLDSTAQRAALVSGQQPTAACFGCVDSRVPAESVLDQGLGELFTIRTAGHVVDDAVLGSLEYGVDELGIPLVIVLGHERCGAVGASIEAVDAGARPPNAIAALVDAIRPAVLDARGVADPQARLDATIHRHTLNTVAELQRRSTLLADAVARGALSIVGARYSLTTGELLPL